jgi:protein SCO1/2
MSGGIAETGGTRSSRPSRFAAFAFLGWLAATTLWWALALAPLPVPPEWLDRARAVCFGSAPGGLPDSWGWMLLALGPLSLLAFLVAVWHRDLAAWSRRLSASAAGIAFLASLAAPPLLAMFWLADRVEARERGLSASTALAADEGDRLPAAYPRASDPAPAIELVDQRGENFSSSEFAGRPALVTFAYAHCQTVCPGLVYAVRGAAEQLGDRATPVVITLDPWRDTPSSLPALARAWGFDRSPGLRLLSGEIEEVLAVQHGYGMQPSRDAATGEIGHPGLVFVLDPEGRIAYRFLNPPASWLVDAVGRLASEAG